MKVVREHRHRLPADQYAGSRTVVFTACVWKRIHLFTDAGIVRAMEQLLCEAATLYHSEIDIYVFMPDHLHIILSSSQEEGDPLSAMKRFKQRSNYWLARQLPGVRWQKDFYDRIIRNYAELRHHIRYILENPIHAGLAESWKEYPFIGSTVHNLDEWGELFGM